MEGGGSPSQISMKFLRPPWYNISDIYKKQVNNVQREQTQCREGEKYSSFYWI